MGVLALAVNVAKGLALAAALTATDPAPPGTALTPVCQSLVLHDRMLNSRFGETVLQAGKMRFGQYMLFYLNRDTRTWTMLAVNARGWACVIATGRDFYQFKTRPDKEETPIYD